jgi:quinol monooxygenase YgiN
VRVPAGLRRAVRRSAADARFRIFEVWESQDHFDRFAEDRLQPILRDIGAGSDPPKLTTYELHEYIAT